MDMQKDSIIDIVMVNDDMVWAVTAVIEDIAGLAMRIRPMTASVEEAVDNAVMLAGKNMLNTNEPSSQEDAPLLLQAEIQLWQTVYLTALAEENGMPATTASDALEAFRQEFGKSKEK
jgi:hypothetical protein